MSDYPGPTSISRINDEATEKASKTTYPRVVNGPADAFRHIVGMAELRMRYGIHVSGAVGMANEAANSPTEWFGKATGMDLGNNPIGERVGGIARNSEEIEQMAHAEIRAAAIEGGSGRNGTAKYLKKKD